MWWSREWSRKDCHERFRRLAADRRDGVAESEYSKSIRWSRLERVTRATYRLTPRHQCAAHRAPALPLVASFMPSERHAHASRRGAVAPRAPGGTDSYVRAYGSHFGRYRTVRERLNQIRTTTGTRPSAARPRGPIGPDLSRSDDRSRTAFANVSREAPGRLQTPHRARRAARSRRRGSAEPVDPPRRRGDVRSFWAIRSASRVSGTAATQKAGIPV